MKSIKNVVMYWVPSMLLVSPVIASAQGEGIFSLINQLGGIIRGLIPIVIGLAVLFFLWGVLKYVVSKDDEAQKEARGVMLYGIIALFVMVSVWGLVNILGDTLRLNPNTPPAPQIPQP
jgi:hypothetical protein